MVRLLSGSREKEEEVEIRYYKRKKESKRSRRTCVKNNLIRRLPEEITLSIISRLSVESILHCRRVCKNWRNLLPLLHDNNTYFANMHLSRGLQKDSTTDTKLSFVFFGGKSLYYLEYDENVVQSNHKHKRINLPLLPNTESLVGSCNGLICLSVTESSCSTYDPVYICNPITREFVHLPRNIMDKRDKYTTISEWFGYHPSTKEYKVVRVYYCIDHMHLYVYTLGSSIGWRNKGEIARSLEPNLASPNRPSQGALLDGALHWISMEGNIVAFDLADEEFRLLPTIPTSPYWYCSSRIWVLGGWLGVCHWKTTNDAEIWLLKKKNEEKHSASSNEQCWSWSREFTIAIEYAVSFLYQPFTITKSGEILLLYKGKSTVCCDQKPSAIPIKFVELDEAIDCEQAVLHFNSFVSLKTLGENAEIL